MKKYVAQVRKPCPFNAASEQAKNWSETHEMKIFVSDDGRVFTKTPVTQSSMGSRIRNIGGKWVEKSRDSFRYESLEQFLIRVSAKESDFNGKPKFN